MTFSSKSDNKNLKLELNQYTKNLGKLLKIQYIYANFVGSEKCFLKQVEKLKKEKSS